MSIERCYEMSQLAGIAYLDGKAAKKLYKKMGWNGHKFIEVKGAQCHVIWDSKEMAICFRGTEPDEFSDIKADLNAWPDTAHNGHGKVHNGFQEEINKIWHNILEVMEAQKCYHLYICGHSLGGAMATIAASRLGDKVSALYTYGSPRSGNSQWTKSIQCPHYRHVNNNDIVPKVPPRFMGYRHHGELRYINFYGNIRKMTAWQRFKDGWRGRVTAWKKKQPFDGARDHGMANYVKYLEKENG